LIECSVAWHHPRPPQSGVVENVGPGEHPGPPCSPEAAATAEFSAAFRPAADPAWFSRVCCVLCVHRKPERRQPGTARGRTSARASISEVPGCLRRQPGGEGAGHSCCSSRSSSLCPWSPQVSALLSRATTDRCVPCAGWGRPDKRCAPASGEYACLSLSSCVCTDNVCILLGLS